FDAIFERALAKDPADRYPTASDFVDDLRSALHDDTADTWAEPPVRRTHVATHRGGRRWGIPLLLAALLAGGALAAVIASRGSKHPVQAGAHTILRTVTSPDRTVTTAYSGSQLNDAGFAKMRRGDYAGALPLLEQAVQKLSGTGATVEAYADYNLAFTRRKLGQCTAVLQLLQR